MILQNKNQRSYNETCQTEDISSTYFEQHPNIREEKKKLYSGQGRQCQMDISSSSDTNVHDLDHSSYGAHCSPQMGQGPSPTNRKK